MHLRPEDLRAAARLALAATQGVIRVTEGVHQAVRRTLGAPEAAVRGRTTGLTGQVYRSVRGITTLVGRSLDAALAAWLPHAERVAPDAPESPEREAVLSALNGVLGDRLAAEHSPLAIPMELRLAGRALPLDDPGALARQVGTATREDLLVLVHGLCMGDAQWRRDGHDHGAQLSAAFDCTALYLRYNSGLHISDNGRNLAERLEQLLAVWPRPVRRLVLLGHSMGGLVMRSAVHAAQAAGHAWPARLQAMVFLGTPHHGAPLERAGHGVDLLLAATPWTAPLARLGQLRSAGITDLRYGAVLESDWRGADRFAAAPDRRTPVPLPAGVDCFLVAATLAGRGNRLAERLLGDGLVPLPSALGDHPEPRRRLQVTHSHRHIAWRTGHLGLLSSTEVAARLERWLAPVCAQRSPRLAP
ncbi:PGAP1-like protein [Tibeticola sediminis]|uniref:PGAP1-like protein n=1 Tax=Tibeticola sediminis TaxID=1917811 RepID=A0A3N4UAE4_9BURK|nr:alpha/beta hydrolase [Tibeticola sediminis]RPE66748.1 PGAP1-like protein [Tibeticola sediminis]